MNLLQRIFSYGRIRRAKRELAVNPNPRGYLALAQLYAQTSKPKDAQRVCQEGLSVFPDNQQLVRFHQRAQRSERETRLAELRRELLLSPRPPLWRELCEILIDSDELTRAEEELRRWFERDQDPEARYLLARVALARFLADRGREQGRAALAAIAEAIDYLPGDARPLRAKLELMARVGAWAEARDAAGQLLALEPGALELEGRYRSLSTMAEDAPTFERALHQVELSGNLAEDHSGRPARVHNGTSVRPMLRELATQSDVAAALYVRGSTAIVQGPRGATAERTARAVQAVLASTRSAGRRLGLGQVYQVQLEGIQGTLTIAPGEHDAGAVLCRGALGRPREEALMGLAGLNADTAREHDAEEEDAE